MQNLFYSKIYVLNKIIDSTLPCVCSVIDHRWCQNVVKTKKWQTSRRRVSVTDVFTTFFTSSVIYYWRDPRQHGIYLFYTMIRKKKTDTHTCLIPLDCSKICASLGKTANSSLIAMTHDGNCCEDFLNFRHS